MAFVDEWLVPTVQSILPEVDVDALRDDAGADASLWETLVRRRLCSDDTIARAVALRFRLPLADLSHLDERAREVLPEGLIRRFSVVPVRATDTMLEVATANPFDMEAEKMLAFASGREVRVTLASPAQVKERLDLWFNADEAVARLLGGMEAEAAEVTQLEDEQEDIGADADEASKGPIVRLVDMMLADGIASRASDVHVEPVEGGVVVRYRIDGVLRQVMKIPRSAGVPLISRIKIMSGLDIADRRRPQDGRARVAVNGQPVDLRVSTLPSAAGEKVVIRILNAKATLLSLDTLGFHDFELASIRSLLDNKEGIILVTGPTGSGKTTTLYSALRVVQGEGINIITVEDPVEYRLGENIVQVQVHEKAGLTFSAALRSILRQDPDVVLVGEIRDRETAQIAVQASLTGHLVLSTLHTNDAATAITRLVDMGVEPYKIASSLRGVVAQRLMRRLCQTCATDFTGVVPPRVARWLPPGATLRQAVGCADCANTGYRGRFCIGEIITITPEFRRRLSAGVTASEVAAVAREYGMRYLWESGLQHIARGDSTIEELLRVTDVPDEGGLATVPEAPPAAAAPPAPAPVARPAAAPAPVAAPPAAPAIPAAPPPAAEPLADSFGFDLVDDLILDAGPALRAAGRGACILLVEDEDHLRRVMRDLLEREGYRVAEAKDGVQALDEVDRHAPDLIMLDLNLPGLDGYGVLAQLRSRPATREIPVVVLTAKGDEDNEVRVFQLGADDFLSKPFRAKALSARLEAVLNRRRAS